MAWELSGNTYEHRDAIKRIGGRWDAARKLWVVEEGSMRERANQESVIFRLSRQGVRVEQPRGVSARRDTSLPPQPSAVKPAPKAEETAEDIRRKSEQAIAYAREMYAKAKNDSAVEQLDLLWAALPKPQTKGEAERVHARLTMDGKGYELYGLQSLARESEQGKAALEQWQARAIVLEQTRAERAQQDAIAKRKAFVDSIPEWFRDRATAARAYHADAPTQLLDHQRETTVRSEGKTHKDIWEPGTPIHTKQNGWGIAGKASKYKDDDDDEWKVSQEVRPARTEAEFRAIADALERRARRDKRAGWIKSELAALTAAVSKKEYRTDARMPKEREQVGPRDEKSGVSDNFYLGDGKLWHTHYMYDYGTDVWAAPLTPELEQRVRRLDAVVKDTSGKEFDQLTAAPLTPARADEFPEKVGWRHGQYFIVHDTDKEGKTQFTGKNPGVPAKRGKGSAKASYTVLTRDDDPPVRTSLNLGIVEAETGETLAFRPTFVRAPKARDLSPRLVPPEVGVRKGKTVRVFDTRTGLLTRVTDRKPRNVPLVRREPRPTAFRRRRGL